MVNRATASKKIPARSPGRPLVTTMTSRNPKIPLASAPARLRSPPLARRLRSERRPDLRASAGGTSKGAGASCTAVEVYLPDSATHVGHVVCHRGQDQVA